MSLTRRRFLSIGAVGGALIGCSRKTHNSANTSKSAAWAIRTAKLQQRIAESMSNQRVPGASVAIIQDARIAWAQSFGVRDLATGVPVDDDTIFSAQSMSKPIFAYRVMKLSEQGVIDLDAPLSRYLRDEFVKNDPRSEEITARRVLSHTTGLPNWRSKKEPLRINFAPGTKWSYSGEGYHYLQSVMTQLTGHTDSTRCGNFELNYRVCATDFGESMEANVLRPFGMTSSGYVWTTAIDRQLATGHDHDGHALPNRHATAVDVARYGSAGSLLTTATDYAKFVIEVMEPKPSDNYRLNERTRREMLTPQIAAAVSPIKMSWALGWQIWHLENAQVVAHGGDIEGWHSQAVFAPDRRTGFVILTNGEGGSPMIWTDLLPTLLDEFVLT